MPADAMYAMEVRVLAGSIHISEAYWYSAPWLLWLGLSSGLVLFAVLGKNITPSTVAKYSLGAAFQKNTMLGRHTAGHQVWGSSV